MHSVFTHVIQNKTTNLQKKKQKEKENRIYLSMIKNIYSSHSGFSLIASNFNYYWAPYFCGKYRKMRKALDCKATYFYILAIYFYQNIMINKKYQVNKLSGQPLFARHINLYVNITLLLLFTSFQTWLSSSQPSSHKCTWLSAFWEAVCPDLVCDQTNHILHWKKDINSKWTPKQQMGND